MPTLQSVRSYLPNQPYYYDIDNLPIADLANNISIVNAQVDLNSKLLNDASPASPVTLAYRLNTCMDSLGNLLQTAVDNAAHHIGDHYEAVVNPLVNDYYVIMKNSERSRLASMADNATSFSLAAQIGPYGNVSTTNFGNVTLQPSKTINWTTTTQSGQQYLTANYAFSGTAHQHIYAEVNSKTTDYINYTVLGGSYISGTLRVYLNGVRLNENSYTYVPSTSPTPTWTQYKFTESNSSVGTFALNTTTSGHTLLVDYDQSLTS